MKVVFFVARGNEDTIPQPYWEEFDPTEVMLEIQGGSNVSDLPRGTLTGSGFRDSWFTQEYFRVNEELH
jgi:hypothetical protein